MGIVDSYGKPLLIYIYMKNEIKRGPGRPRKLTDEKGTKNKTTYMLNRPWYCDICNTGRNYTLAGKHCHLNTVKHKLNTEINVMKKIFNARHND